MWQAGPRPRSRWSAAAPGAGPVPQWPRRRGHARKGRASARRFLRKFTAGSRPGTGLPSSTRRRVCTARGVGGEPFPRWVASRPGEAIRLVHDCDDRMEATTLRHSWRQLDPTCALACSTPAGDDWMQDRS